MQLQHETECNISKTNSNLTRSESQAIKELTDRNYLVVRAVDKGGAIVVLDRGLHKSLNLNMLQNLSTYTYVPSDPTSVFQNELKKPWSEEVASGAITQKIAEHVFVDQPIIPIYHSLPIIYKDCLPPPNWSRHRGTGREIGFMGGLSPATPGTHFTQIFTGH